jgi:nucleoid DNA-binding protein/nucleoid-associated protein YgaU
MSEKLNIQDLGNLLANKHEMTHKEADVFVRTFFQLIEEALEQDSYVKIKGFGTFKLITVDSRESIDVNTGERIEIKSYTKISFIPDSALRDLINKPFAHFETVILNDDVSFDEWAVADEEVPATIAEQEETPAEIVATVETEDTLEAEKPPVEKLLNTDLLIKKEDAEERPRRSGWIIGILIAILLALGLVYWFYYILKTNDLTSNSTELTEYRTPPLPVDSISKKDTLNIYLPSVQQTDSIEAKPQIEMDQQVVYDDSTSYIITGTRTTHQLRSGETLRRLSLKYYGTKALWSYLAQHNPSIKNPNHVPIGATIRIPELAKKNKIPAKSHRRD